MTDTLVLSREGLGARFAERVEALSGQNPYDCYQCGKCSAGCLFAEHMDALPNQVLRLVQLGDEAVLELEAPWVCAACLACEVRCPKGVDIARTMEALRQLALRRGARPVTLHLECDHPQIALVGAFRKMTP